MSGTDPIAALVEEHRQFLGRLDGFATELRGWLARPRIAPIEARSIVDYAEFLARDVDRWHARKEEEFLFPALGAHLPVDAGPLATMIAEHELVREEQRVLALGGRRLGSDGEALDALQGVVRAEERARTLLTSHIEKEDQVLFPMARSLLSEDEMARVARGFDGIDSEREREGRR